MPEIKENSRFRSNDNFAKTSVTSVSSIISIPPRLTITVYWHCQRFASWLREDRNTKSIAFLSLRSDFLTTFMSREIIKPSLRTGTRRGIGGASKTIFAR